MRSRRFSDLGRGFRAVPRLLSEVPPDSFFFCAAAITGSSLTLHGLDMEDSQGDKAVLPILEKMGCGVAYSPGSITITGPDKLRGERLTGTELDLNATPDALPALAAAACFATGETRLTNVPQARLKETDRITVMAEELSKIGADIEELPDGLLIRGSGPDGEPRGLRGSTVDGRSDHRVVMALAIAGLGARGTTTIDTAEAVDITFPGFFRILEGLRVRE